MTPDQIAVLRAEIEGDPALSAQPRNSDGAYEIAAVLNLPSEPPVYLWQECWMTTRRLMTFFGLVRGAQIIQALRAAAALNPVIAEILPLMERPESLGVDAGSAEAFAFMAGLTAIGVTQAEIDVLREKAQRRASRFEALYASDGKTAVDHPCTVNDVLEARG